MGPTPPCLHNTDPHAPRRRLTTWPVAQKPGGRFGEHDARRFIPRLRVHARLPMNTSARPAPRPRRQRGADCPLSNMCFVVVVVVSWGSKVTRRPTSCTKRSTRPRAGVVKPMKACGPCACNHSKREPTPTSGEPSFGHAMQAGPPALACDCGRRCHTRVKQHHMTLWFYPTSQQTEREDHSHGSAWLRSRAPARALQLPRNVKRRHHARCTPRLE